MPFGGDLPQLDIPLLALPCVLGCEARRERRELRLGGVGFLVRVDAFAAVPHPLPIPLRRRRQAGGNDAWDEKGFVEPRPEDAIKPSPLEFVTLDADVLLVQLAVQAGRRVVVRRGVESRLVVRQINAPRDLAEDRPREGLVVLVVMVVVMVTASVNEVTMVVVAVMMTVAMTHVRIRVVMVMVVVLMMVVHVKSALVMVAMDDLMIVVLVIVLMVVLVVLVLVGVLID